MSWRPLAYVHERIGRSIETRVQTATKLAADAQTVEVGRQRVEFERRLDEVRAGCDAECQRLQERLGRQHRALTDLAEQIRGIQRTLDTSARSQRLESKAASSKISGLGQSIGATAASVTDAQRQAAALLEQLARRVASLENLCADMPSDPASRS